MKVELNFTKGQATIEGDGPEVLGVFQLIKEIAPKISEIKIVSGGEPKGAGSVDSADKGAKHGGGTGKLTMREFARALRPSGLSEQIVVIAAYVERVEGRAAFSAKEMNEWFVICGFQKPSQMSASLFDAKRNNGFLEKAGHGVWRLSTSGENLAIRKMEESGTIL
jgi:hypothetical protein